MPRIDLTPQLVKGPHPGAIAANDLDITFAAADVTNKNQFALTGKELIVAKNTSTTAARNVTLTSADDPQKRKSDINSFSLGIGETMAFWVGSLVGWLQSDGKFYLEADNAEVQFAILRIP